MDSRILTNAGIMLLARIVSGIVSFFLLPFMLKQLGAESVGILSLAISFSASSGFMALLDLGMQPALVVYMAGYIAQKDLTSLNGFISTALLIFAGMGLLAGGVLFLANDILLTKVFSISVALLEDSRLVFQIMAVQVFIEFIGAIPLAFLEGTQNYKVARGVITLSGIIRAALTVAVVLLGFGIVGVALLQLAEALTIYACLTYFMFRQNDGIRIKSSLFSKKLAQELLRFSKPILGQRISGLIFRQTDRIIIGSLLSVSMVAYYNIIQGLFRNVMIFQSFSPVVLPAASQVVAEDNHEKLRDMFIRNTKYATALTSQMAMIAAVLMYPLLKFWVGTEFVNLTGLSQAYVLMALGASAVGIGQAMLTPLGYAKESMYFSLISGIISFAGSLATISKWHLSGIVWTTILGAAVGWVLHFKLILKRLELRFSDLMIPLLFRSYASIIAASVGLWLVVRLRAPESLGEVFMYGAGAAVLNLMLFYRTGLDKEERAALRSKLLLRKGEMPIM